MLRLWPTDGREHLKQPTTDLPLYKQNIILFKKSQAFKIPKSSQVAWKLIVLRPSSI